MNQIASLRCPYCKATTEIRELRCDRCECEIKGSFAANEFAYLEKEDLHFLRMFLQFEGRVRDMEAPLGLSYPTIRSRLVQLKAKVFGDSAKTFNEPAEEPRKEPKSEAAQAPESALDELEQGKISFEETLRKLKNKKRGKS
ncbi:MAG: DUF2089 family protein [Bdellovibrionota bacterium]